MSGEQTVRLSLSKWWSASVVIGGQAFSYFGSFLHSVLCNKINYVCFTSAKLVNCSNLCK